VTNLKEREMPTYSKKYKAVVSFIVYKDLLGQTKYQIENLDTLLVDMLEGDYQEDINFNESPVDSPIGSVYVENITELGDWVKED